MIGTLFVGATVSAKKVGSQQYGERTSGEPMDSGKAKNSGAGSDDLSVTAQDPSGQDPSGEMSAAGVEALPPDEVHQPEIARRDAEAEARQRELVERARSGDLDAFRELVKKYQSRVFAVAFAVLRSREDAEDVVQDGFLKAYRNLNSFRGQSSFYTWLYRIVFNLAIDLSRKKYRRTEASVGEYGALDGYVAAADERAGGAGRSTDVVIGNVPGPEDVLHRGELKTKITEAMDTLSADHRAVIVLREIDGLSYAEIADAVGCTKGTVMSRLHHARRRLQKILAEFAPAGTSLEREGNHKRLKDSELRENGIDNGLLSDSLSGQESDEVQREAEAREAELRIKGVKQSYAREH